ARMHTKSATTRSDLGMPHLLKANRFFESANYRWRDSSTFFAARQVMSCDPGEDALTRGYEPQRARPCDDEKGAEDAERAERLLEEGGVDDEGPDDRNAHPDRVSGRHRNRFHRKGKKHRGAETEAGISDQRADPGKSVGHLEA